MARVARFKSLLWFVLGVGLVSMAVRLASGLGAVTHLSHYVSWGLWNAVKLSIVPLSAGGFVLAAVVYIFHRERFRPLLRLAILTGFLGYSTFATMLLFDLGVPHRIWHPVIYWQPRSVLFEVAWCVMLYLSVLALEFVPNVLERPAFQKRRRLHQVYTLIKGLTIPLVIAGIVLSTLHQSSLGSLFLIVPHRLDPLWYSAWIHVLFLISAIGMGLLVIVVQAFLMEFFYGVPAPLNLLAPLARAGGAAMLVFGTVRLVDQVAGGVLPAGLARGPAADVFLVETLLAVVMPALLLSGRVRASRAGLLTCSLSAVAGVVLYRFNVALLAIDWGPGTYFPAWTEITLCLGILAGAVLVFLVLVERLSIYFNVDALAAASVRRSSPVGGADFENRLVWASLSPGKRYSLWALVGATAAVLVLPPSAVFGLQPRRTPVAGARTISGFRHERPGTAGWVLQPAGSGRALASNGRPVPLMMIDGNRDGRLVLFDHAGHARRLEDRGGCAVCHHMSLPLDETTACWECHRDMYEPQALFRHTAHVRYLGGNAGCAECHAETPGAKSLETSTACAECHADMVRSDAVVRAPAARWNEAVGYMEAMHGLCVRCHQSAAGPPGAGARREHLARCDTCHEAELSPPLEQLRPQRRSSTAGAFRPEPAAPGANRAEGK